MGGICRTTSAAAGSGSCLRCSGWRRRRAARLILRERCETSCATPTWSVSRRGACAVVHGAAAWWHPRGFGRADPCLCTSQRTAGFPHVSSHQQWAFCCGQNCGRGTFWRLRAGLTRRRTSVLCLATKATL